MSGLGQYQNHKDNMFNEDILIDRNALDEECQRAPAFFDYWQTKESDLKTQVESCEISLNREIRSLDENAIREKYRVSKATEGAINSIVKDDPKYKSLRRQYLQAEASRKSWEKKIGLLDTLAKLHGQGYFAKIESRKDTRTFIANEVKKKIKEEIKRRTRKPSRPKR